ncbi:hypothetical protein [Methylocapsa aurea]|uniref:hypothetical protein n=1 Tax=Methylocapsa aurea TaxID=663610 RepID=UPI00055F90C0|nr:hypothetical protein [Methylocapsa aurea]
MGIFGPIARALLDEGCSGEQIAAAVTALEQAREREREERLARLREGARLRQQRCRERKRALRHASRCDGPLPPSPEVPPKEYNQTPFLTPTSGERAPAPGRLPVDFEACAEDRAFGQAEGLSEGEVARSARDLKLWAAANAVRRADWHAELRRFMARDAETKRARGVAAPGAGKADIPTGIWVRRDSPQGDAWWTYARAATGRSPPIDKRGGWHFATEWPPAVTSAAVGAAP